MSYSYQTEKQKILTDEGQRIFLTVRDHVKMTLELSGAITLGKAIDVRISGPADSWTLMACVDRMVELGEIIEVGSHGGWAQHRVFVAGRTEG